MNSLPEGDEDTQRKVGEWIMSRNKAMKVGYKLLTFVLQIRSCSSHMHYCLVSSSCASLLQQICVARTNPLSTEHRSPGDSGLVQLAGPPRNPIVTSHYEYGVKCVVVSVAGLVFSKS